jgi:hypothetical protein
MSAPSTNRVSDKIIAARLLIPAGREFCYPVIGGILPLREARVDVTTVPESFQRE